MRAKPVSGCTYALHLSLPIGQEQAEQAVPFVAAFVRNSYKYSSKNWKLNLINQVNLIHRNFVERKEIKTSFEH